MDALEFIEKDNARLPSPMARAVIVALVAIVPVGLGIGLREDLIGVFEPRVLVPNLACALLVALAVSWGVARRFTSPFELRLVGASLGAATVLAVKRGLFPSGARTTYASAEQFWREGARCFSKGSTTTLLVGVALVTFAFGLAPLPTRRRRAAIAAVAGVAGAVMLSFHCDSSSLGHLAVGHLASGLVFGCAVFVIQELVVRARLAGLFPRLQNPGRLGL